VAGLPASFTISNAISGRPNWIRAFLDVNGNGVCEAWEPVGHTPGAPHSLVQQSTGLDVTLGNPDRDADGMDDIWEMSRFGSLIPDPDSDADGDGVTNGDEFLQGTDPLVSDGEENGVPAAAETVIGDAGLNVFTPPLD